MKNHLVLVGATMALLFASACSTTPAGTPAADAPSSTAQGATAQGHPPTPAVLRWQVAFRQRRRILAACS